MDEYHSKNYEHHCYICGRFIFLPVEVEEGLCQDCGKKIDQRLSDFTFDLNLPQEY